MGIGHDFSQAVHRLVQIVHSFPLPAVDFQSQVLHLVFAELRPGLGLTATTAAFHHALVGLAVCSVLLAVRLEHLIGEEAPS